MSLSKRSAPSPTVKIGTELRTKGKQFVSDRRTRIVCAIAQHHEPRQWHRVEILTRLFDRRPSAFRSALKRRSATLSISLRRRRKAKQSHDELLSQCFEQCAVRPAERMLDPVAARPSHRDRRSACCVNRRSERRRSSAAELRRTTATSDGRGTPRERRAPRLECPQHPSIATACFSRGRRRN